MRVRTADEDALMVPRRSQNSDGSETVIMDGSAEEKTVLSAGPSKSESKEFSVKFL